MEITRDWMRIQASCEFAESVMQDMMKDFSAEEHSLLPKALIYYATVDILKKRGYGFRAGEMIFGAWVDRSKMLFAGLNLQYPDLIPLTIGSADIPFFEDVGILTDTRCGAFWQACIRADAERSFAEMRAIESEFPFDMSDAVNYAIGEMVEIRSTVRGEYGRDLDEEKAALCSSYIHHANTYVDAHIGEMRKFMAEKRKKDGLYLPDPPRCVRDRESAPLTVPDAAAEDEGRTYRYCMVRFAYGDARYSYLLDDLRVFTGDFVRVPTGRDDLVRTAVIDEIRVCTRANAPWPPERTKHVLALAERPAWWPDRSAAAKAARSVRGRAQPTARRLPAGPAADRARSGQPPGWSDDISRQFEDAKRRVMEAAERYTGQTAAAEPRTEAHTYLLPESIRAADRMRSVAAAQSAKGQGWLKTFLVLVFIIGILLLFFTALTKPAKHSSYSHPRGYGYSYPSSSGMKSGGSSYGSGQTYGSSGKRAGSDSSFSSYGPYTGGYSRPSGSGSGGSSYRIRDDYDNPEDLYDDEWEWYEDEDDAWDDWYDG